MKAINIAATAAVSVLCLSVGQSWADDPNALSAMHVMAGQRAANHWTPAAITAATMPALPEVDIGGLGGGDGGSGSGDGGTGIGGLGGGGGGSGGGGGGNGGGGSGSGTDGGTGTIGGGGIVGGGDGGGGGGGGGGTTSQPMWGGKLYFTAPDGDYFCEAQFVSKNVVMTAAQCLQDDKSGDYFTNIQFVQELPGGQKKVFDSECSATFKGWAQPGNDKWTYDMGMVLLSENSQVGWMRFAWNYDTIGPFGYMGQNDYVKPASGKLSGQNGIVQMRPQGGAKDMLGGAAWVTALKDDKGQLATAFSLMSFTNPKQPGVYFGPYFDDKIKTLFDYAQNGCQ